MEEIVIARNRYLEQLRDRMHNGLVKVITGIRRCGKSFLLFRIFREYLAREGVDAAHVIEVKLDEKPFVPLRNPNMLFDYITARIPQDGAWTYVFIDEIQYCRKVKERGVRLKDLLAEDRETAYVTFYDILNALMQLPHVDVYVTGSNSRMLSKDVATNFRDRGFEIALHPLTFSEFLPVSGMERAEAFEWYMTWGGMPRAGMRRRQTAR